MAYRLKRPGELAMLAVTDTATNRARVVARTDKDIQSVHWVSSERLLYTLNVDLNGPSRSERGAGLFGINLDGTRFRPLVDNVGGESGDNSGELMRWDTRLVHLGRTASDPHVWMARFDEWSKERVGHAQLWKVNTLNTQRVDLDSPPDTIRWIFNAQNQLSAVVTFREGKESIQVLKAGRWETMLTQSNLSPDRIFPLFSKSPTELIVEARNGEDKLAIYVLNTETKKLDASPLFRSNDFDLEVRPILQAGKLKGLRFVADAEVTHWIDPSLAALQVAVDKRLPSTVNRLSLAEDEGAAHVLIWAYSDRNPGVAYVLNTQTQQFSRIGAAHPQIEPRRMGSSDFVSYSARDGLKIPAYLTLPAGAEKKNLPLVVLVHGGPYLRGSTWGFDEEVQFLASRGYAVLQPEFRGSTGFGSKHFRAGFKQWGQAMQDDVEDGVKWAVAQGVADPNRVCIAGASYGGYAVMMGLIRHPASYRCGINWVGVSDLELLYTVRWSDLLGDSKRYGMPMLVGDPKADQAMLQANSLLRLAAKVKAPLLLAHGAWDERVPVIHAEKLRDALREARHTDLEWVVYPNEGHGWVRPETQHDFWSRVERFLAKHIGPAPR